jgi:hypothetical protein
LIPVGSVHDPLTPYISFATVFCREDIAWVLPSPTI